MATLTEIAPDIYRISIYVQEFGLQFNQFLVKDEEPLLCHTGMAHMFTEVRDAVAKLIEPSRIRWIFSSHFEADECGALNAWLAEVPSAQPACSAVGAITNFNDFSIRAPRALEKGDVLETGRYRFRFLRTPHLPHGWDAGMLFEESNQTLFCSDLFVHNGDVEAITESDIADRARGALIGYQNNGLMADSMPFTPQTRHLLHELAGLKPKTLAIMHGSSFVGNGELALQDLALVLKKIYGGRE
ncbi:MBL fold metallo-hydrolase [Sulfuricella sp.]|uniref:MBL fold metallo-hydrolase n=1 Tax=Sulfuricella sp. TaxID=2099377 RepID=UPI002D0066FB|nr:MBL fold metallo-hydrolase [Sulfuricella sp.]HUX63751.1 MBL fold metallo-hydrolase [Sulfuricella sp.]